MPPKPPIRTSPIEARSCLIRLPDDSIMAVMNRGERGEAHVVARRTMDDGETWTQEESLFDLAPVPGGWGGQQSMVDSNGDLHVFLTNDAHTGAIMKVSEGETRQKKLDISEMHLDVWHTKSQGDFRSWTQPKLLWEGWCGAFNTSIQLSGGRILLPFGARADRDWHNRGAGLDAFTFMGSFEIVVLYSDDFGETWKLSPEVIKLPTHTLHNYGADEPVLVEKRDGSVWMLIRSQLGRLYESHSSDGIHWPRPTPTQFFSSDSPAGIARQEDGRLVLFWNNSLRYPYALGGRHVLHAAVSDDDGVTWQGFREVYRDPLNHMPPDIHHDYGTAYPYPVGTGTGKTLVATGQGHAHTIIRVDPDWLANSGKTFTLSGDLDQWSVFGTRGVASAPNPAGSGSEPAQVLSIGKSHPDWPAVAIGNMPHAVAGSLRLQLYLQAGCTGVRVGLTDHFSTPFDFDAELHNVFNFKIDADGKTPVGTAITTDRWHTITLRWDLRTGACVVLSGTETLQVLKEQRVSTGISYLRIGSPEPVVASAGFFVGRVEADDLDFRIME